MCRDCAGFLCAEVGWLQSEHEDVPVGDIVVSAGMMSKTLLEFTVATVETSCDDSLAGTLTAEVARVGGSDVV